MFTNIDVLFTNKCALFTNKGTPSTSMRCCMYILEQSINMFI